MESALDTAKKGRPYRGVSPEARDAGRREALIDAATQIFGTAGFRRATVRAICRQARLNDRYFYTTFASMEALLQSTYLHHAARLRASIGAARAAAGAGLEAQIDAGLQAFFGFLRDSCAARVLLFEVMGVSAATDAVYQRNIVEFGRTIMTMTGDAPVGDEAAPARAGVDRWIVGLALVGALTNVASAWVLTGYRDPEETMVRNCRHVLLRTLQAGGDVP